MPFPIISLEVDEDVGDTCMVVPVSAANDVADAGVGNALVIATREEDAAIEFVAVTVTVVIEVVMSDVTTDAPIST
jgi:hypothetical protein